MNLWSRLAFVLAVSCSLVSQVLPQGPLQCTFNLLQRHDDDTDVCREEGERILTPLPSTVDFAGAVRLLVEENADRREKLAYLKAGQLHVPCKQDGAAAAAVGVNRTLLITLVPHFHGSTALEMLLLSNRNVASLCAGNSFQCEGVNLGRGGQSLPCIDGQNNSNTWQCILDDWRTLQVSAEGNMLVVPNSFAAIHQELKFAFRHGSNKSKEAEELEYTAAVGDMLATFSSVWDLSKPVLLEKSPAWFNNVEMLHEAVLRYSGPWPLRKVRPVYVAMWRPICLAGLSQNLRADFLTRKKTALEIAKREVGLVGRAVSILKWAEASGARVVAVNYADVLWNATKVSLQISKLLPCIAETGFDPKWTPTVGVDVFPENQLKTQGSTFEYGQMHPPESACYDVQSQKCVSNFWECFHTFQPSTDSEQHFFANFDLGGSPGIAKLMETYNSYVDFLLQHSN